MKLISNYSADFPKIIRLRRITTLAYVSDLYRLRSLDRQTVDSDIATSSECFY